VTAPATVSGEVRTIPLETHENGDLGRCFNRQSRESGDLPNKTTKGLLAQKIEFGLTEGDMTTTILTTSVSASQRIAIGAVTLFFGMFMIYGVGLAQDDRMHNAAHDTRHSIGFPCH
jgi:cobalt transporter subunit CbtB